MITLYYSSNMDAAWPFVYTGSTSYRHNIYAHNPHRICSVIFLRVNANPHLADVNAHYLMDNNIKALYLPAHSTPTKPTEQYLNHLELFVNCSQFQIHPYNILKIKC